MTEASSMLPDTFNEDDMLDMYAEYYVSGGVLSGVRIDADVELHVIKNSVVADVVETVTAYTTITDYGTTVVESPIPN